MKKKKEGRKRWKKEGKKKMKEMKALFTECMLATFLQVITFTSKGLWEASFLSAKKEIPRRCLTASPSI